MPTNYDKPFTVFYKTKDGELVKFEEIQTISAISNENDEEVCPAVVWPEWESISFDIDMSNKGHRIFMKILHSLYMQHSRKIRNQKRAKEQARRAKLKWDAIHPHQEHDL